MKWKWILWVPVGILALALFILVGGEVVQALWNSLLPPLFGWHTIGFWQALGLLALCRILFGGWGGHGHGGSKWRSGKKERCGNMTPEEREQFRVKMRARWGFGRSGGETTEA